MCKDSKKGFQNYAKNDKKNQKIFVTQKIIQKIYITVGIKNQRVIFTYSILYENECVQIKVNAKENNMSY